jgi:hypothetical protein
MADPILLEIRDVTIALLRDQKITTGHWFLAVQFGLAAGYLPGRPEGNRVPGALLPVLRIGLQSSDEPLDITVNAAELPPVEPTPRRRARPKKNASPPSKR